MILSVSHINKSFGRKKVLKDISFQIDKGEMIGITGENGSGKSTILNLIIGNLNVNSGDIYYKGSVGYCPQECILFPQLTLKENFRYFSSAYDIVRKKCDSQLEFLNEYFHFKKYMQDKVINLSGGTKQKLNLCLALLHNPDILVLDEPYNGFDWHTYNCFWEYAKLLKQRNCAILIVAHLLTNTDMFDRVHELKDGILI
jgi:ABC-type multidrug transport system ATPase subunit